MAKQPASWLFDWWSQQGKDAINPDAFKVRFIHKPECPRAGLPPCTCKPKPHG